MLWSRAVLLGAFATLGVLLASSPARAEHTVRCESEHFDFKRCPIRSVGEVQLVRQLSETPCRRGLTWGYDRRGIWVDEGCAGVFRVWSRRGGHDDDSYGYGRDSGRWRGPYGFYGQEPPWFPAGRTVRCESRHFNYNRCRVNTPGPVRLVRQLSEAPCRRGDTWGYDWRGIWVDKGCAGEFHVSRR
ncbi:MAG: DUF3011 domain-containing protein [Candidatus Binatia bacterium]|nr:DUF3011 domain-containing protein [Candidatus Binatia bacterium]